MDHEKFKETLKKLDRHARLTTVKAQYNAGLISEDKAIEILRRPLHGETKRSATDDSRMLHWSIDEIERELGIEWTYTWGREE